MSYNFLENNVRIFWAEMALDKLLRIQNIVDLIDIGPLMPISKVLLVIYVGDEAFTHLLDVIDGDVDVHLLLCLLHEVVFGQSTVDDSLCDLLVFFFVDDVDCAIMLNLWAVWG